MFLKVSRLPTHILYTDWFVGTGDIWLHTAVFLVADSWWAWLKLTCDHREGFNTKQTVYATRKYKDHRKVDKVQEIGAAIRAEENRCKPRTWCIQVNERYTSGQGLNRGISWSVSISKKLPKKRLFIGKYAVEAFPIFKKKRDWAMLRQETQRFGGWVSVGR
jgi:hypothetical protein